MPDSWYNLGCGDALRKLGSSGRGISDNESKVRLGRFGLNTIEKPAKMTWLKLLIRQFKSPLVLILVAAAVVSWLLADVLSSMAIFAIIIINAAIGFVQEHKAERAMEALKKITALQATVVRDGVVRSIDAKRLVPGDIVMLESGSRVPADVRLLEAFALRVEQAVLTGESSPVSKGAKALRGTKSVAEQGNMLFASTIVVAGRAKGVVVETGMATEFGKIAGMIKGFEEPETPLKKRIDVLARNLGIVTLFVVLLLFFVGMLTNQEPVNMFMIAVALGVSAIPEGLPAVIAITLSIGMLQMSGRNAIVRKMPAVETLGSATVICTDKTGTITRNEMVVEHAYADGKMISVSGRGYEPSGEFSFEGSRVKLGTAHGLSKALEIGLLCNDAVLTKSDGDWGIVGDSTEGALVVAAEKAGIKTSRKRSWEIPFSSERKMMTTFHKMRNTEFAYTKGALEAVLNVCDFIEENGKRGRFGQARKQEMLKKGNELAAQAYRVLGFAYREVGENERQGAEQKMTFVGFVAMRDPPRAGVREAIGVCKTAGIRVMMITGDNPLTAGAVAGRVGLAGSRARAITGAELDRMDAAGFKQAVKDCDVFARVEPKHKYKIVEALKEFGEIVAVTGDGVNDAPALKKADIGVAMGIKGTDVAKTASDIVLRDDNFATIVAAVQEGRRIYTNIKNFVKYLLSVNFSEIGVIGAATIAGYPLPMLPLQILWINIATDSLPALALGNEKAAKDVMKVKPRNPKDGILKNTYWTIAVATTIAMLVTLGGFFAGLAHDTATGVDLWDLGENSMARTMAFSASIMFELAFVFSCRSDKGVFQSNPFSNRGLVAAVAVSFLLLAAAIYLPFLQDVFKTVALGVIDWAVLLALALTSVAVPYMAAVLKKRFG